ncbi:MAG: STAS/SEC14 domain-containing protein [Sulfurifustaceae bacterium]
MIAIEMREDILEVGIYGELALADYRRFEDAVTDRGAQAAPKRKLLLDVRAMTGFTVDVAWEEIKFTRAHSHDFRRIAVVTPGQWAPWVSWVSAAFSDAEVMLFEEPDSADAWLTAAH